MVATLVDQYAEFLPPLSSEVAKELPPLGLDVQTNGFPSSHYKECLVTFTPTGQQQPFWWFEIASISGGYHESCNRPLSRYGIGVYLGEIAAKFPGSEWMWTNHPHLGSKLAPWDVEKPVDKTGWVYFIRAIEIGMMKIGFAKDPLARMCELNTAAPVPLTLIGMFRGTMADERICHAKFAHLRHHNEWFDESKELLDFAKERSSVHG